MVDDLGLVVIFLHGVFAIHTLKKEKSGNAGARQAGLEQPPPSSVLLATPVSSAA